MGEDKRSMLEDQIEDHLEALSNMTPGTDEASKAIKELDVLYKLALDAEADKRKALAEDEDVVRNEQRFAFEQEKFEHQKKQDKIKTGVEVGSLVLGTATTVWAFCKGLKFEMDGTFRSPNVKAALNKLLKFK